MKIVAFIIAFAFFVGGFLLMGYAFAPSSGNGIMFFSGIISIVIALAIPFHVLKRIDN